MKLRYCIKHNKKLLNVIQGLECSGGVDVYLIRQMWKIVRQEIQHAVLCTAALLLLQYSLFHTPKKMCVR